MTTKHDVFPIHPATTTATTGSPLRAESIEKVARMQNYLRNFYGGGLIFTTEFQPPDSTLNPKSSTAAPVHYYPILFAPDKEDNSERQLCGAIMPWNYSSTEGFEVDWFKSYAPGTPGTATNLKSFPPFPYAAGASKTYGDRIRFDPVQLYDEFTYDPQNGIFQVKRLSIEACQVASVTIWAGPDKSLSDSQIDIKPEDVASGKVIRGYTGTGRPSVGDLFHLQGSLSDTADDIERVTRRCMMQIGTAYGFYAGASLSNHRVYGSDHEFRVRGRVNSDIFNIDTGQILPAFVITGTEGAQITVTNSTATTNTTWTYTIPAGGISNPTLIAPTDGTGTIDLIVGDNLCYIEVDTGAGDEIVIYTSSLWEKF